MKDSLRATDAPSTRPRQDGSVQSPTQSSGLFARFLHACSLAWFRFTGPATLHFGHTLQGQERLRRSRLLSALLVLIPISWFLFLPDVLAVPKLWFALMTLVVLGIAAMLLNRGAGYRSVACAMWRLSIAL